MNVEVRLFATLRRYLPAGSDGTKTHLDLPDAARLSDLVQRLGIPPQLAQLVMVDGLHETDHDRVLHDGAVVSIFPPVAGGTVRGEYSVLVSVRTTHHALLTAHFSPPHSLLQLTDPGESA